MAQLLVKYFASRLGRISRIRIGVVIDGCPSGISLNEEDSDISWPPKTRSDKFTARRSEEDTVEILSGIFEGKTTEHWFLFSYVIKTNVPEIMETLFYVSSGACGLSFTEKYGIRDYRGGGRSSGRETIGRVAAGAIASKILNELRNFSLCLHEGNQLFT